MLHIPHKGRRLVTGSVGTVGNFQLRDTGSAKKEPLGWYISTEINRHLPLSAGACCCAGEYFYRE